MTPGRAGSAGRADGGSMQHVTRLLVAALVVCLVASTVYAASDVRAMPDRQVRPGVNLPVWGNAGNFGGLGDGSANGEAYTWSFSANPDVVITDDANLSGIVGNDRYVVEVVSFALINGSTREIITATLDVGGTTDTVQIDIVDPTDPISDTPAENLQVDVNISIADGLRYMYLNQQTNGSWTSNFSGQSSYTVSHTGLCAWAFENSGHAPSQNTAYSPFVQQALDYLFTTGTIVSVAGKPGRNFHSHLAGTVGINPTGPNYPAAGGDFDENYSGPISAAAIIASLTPAAVVGVGPAAGLTYKQWIEEYTDWSNYGQARGYGNNDPEGGWYYYAGVDQNDHSVNSWMYLALEGAETVFGATFDPAIKDSVDTALVNRQEDTLADPGFGRFGYYGKTGVSDVPAYNTTCAGLSGLALEELPGNKSAGTPAYPGTGNPVAPANLDSYVEKRDAALAHLGRWWAVNPSGFSWLNGNHGNHYAMFACCRGLRLNNITTLTNDGTYGGAVGPFNWETNITAPGALTEGYWPFLVRTQNADGSWDPLPGSFPYDADWDTCSAIFCLQPTVFGPPQADCPEDPDPRTQGYWHRQCLGMAANDPQCPGIDPGRNGRGPQAPNDPDFCPEYYDCSNQVLEDLGFFGELTCDALNADPANDKCEKALKQLTALILNRCSGRLQNGCEVDVSAQGCESTDVGSLITELADLIQNGDCNKAASCAGAVNEGDALVGGGGGDTLAEDAETPIETIDPVSPVDPGPGDVGDITRPGRDGRRAGDRQPRRR